MPTLFNIPTTVGERFSVRTPLRLGAARTARAAQGLGFIAFDIDLDQDRNAAAVEQRPVQGLHGDGATGRIRAGHDMVLCIKPDREAGLAILVTHGGYAQFHSFGNLVEADVAFERGGGRRIGLECDGAAANDAGCQDRVTADIGAHIREQVAVPQKMQHEGHIRKFMQTGIDIASDAGHATPGGEASSTNPVDDHLVTNAAHDLPSHIAGHAPLPTGVGA
jgi:hypothetical protein